MVDMKIDGSLLRGVELAIFDKDGTLVEIYNYWAKMIEMRVNLARDILGFGPVVAEKVTYAMGVDTARGRLREEGPVGLRKREVVMRAMAGKLAENGFFVTEELCEEIFAQVDVMSRGRLKELIRPVDGMYGLIESLRRGGCKVAVATTDKTHRARLVIEHLGILAEVDSIVGEDRVKSPKPSPEMVELILEETSTDRRRAIMIGDAVTDMEMGVNAGLLASVGVLSGLTSRKELVARTSYVVRDISEIKVVDGGAI